MVKLTNVSGGQHVCTLLDESTLRLDHGQTEIYPEEILTKHISKLVEDGLFLREEVKTAPKKPVVKEGDA